MPEIMARDLAGNETSSRLLVHALNRNYRSDTLNIPEAFLNFKASELAPALPRREHAACPVSVFQQQGARGQRRNPHQGGRRSGQRVAALFVEAARSVVFPVRPVKANFGDFRTYVDGNRQKIDEQTHMGLDLASVAHAEVPAAQSGRVVWVDYLGIHGNMILIEHGLAS